MTEMLARLICTAAIAAAVLAVPVFLDGPTELQAAQDVAAQVDDARIDEWLQEAKRANPNLTDHELLRIRAAAIYVEQMK